MYGSTCASLLHKVGLAMLCIWLCWKRSLLPVLFSGQLLPDRTHNMWNDRMWHHRGSQTVWTQFSQIIWFDSPISLTLCSGRAASPQHVWCSLGPCQPWQKKAARIMPIRKKCGKQSRQSSWSICIFPLSFKLQIQNGTISVVPKHTNTICAKHFVLSFLGLHNRNQQNSPPRWAEHLRTSCPFPPTISLKSLSLAVLMAESSTLYSSSWNLTRFTRLFRSL